MNEKFDKYFDLLPPFFGITIILDTRLKESGLQYILGVIYGDITQFKPIMQATRRLFDDYKS